MSNDAIHDAEEYVLVTGSDTDEANKLGEEPEVVSQIKSWLTPTEFDTETSEYKKHLNAHVPGTGQWVLETEQYKKWYETDEIGDLWIRGIPGSGKSVVAANLIRKLKAKGDAPVLYFFFRRIILSNRSPQSLVRDCSFQLLDHSPLLQSSLNRVMKKYHAIDQVPFDDLFKCFSSALTAMKKVYCVLDALDEMNLEQDVFLADLLNLGRRYPKTIKLALTSRQLPYLEAHFKGSCLVDLRLDRINVDHDIATYISHRLKNFQAIIMPEEAKAIKVAICEQGKGLFLYARLMMDECIRDPKRFLSRKLPDGLGNMYSNLLTEHSVRSGATQAFQKLVLEWVTHSQRPLRLIELTTVINSMIDRGGLTRLQDTKSMIRTCCGPLLEICEDEVIQIIHHSFTEFLCGSELSHVQMNEQSATRFPVLDPVSIHSNISIACINYLQAGCLKGLALETRRSISDEPLHKNHNFFNKGRYGLHSASLGQERAIDFNFLPYAAEYWPIHAIKVEGPKPDLHQTLDVFMSEENHSYQKWKDIWPGLDSYTPTNLTPLHVSSRCGLKDYTKSLLLRGLDVNIVDGLGRTPLIYAAMGGHDSTVVILLEHSARHDLSDGLGLTAFHYAAKMGYAKTLQHLLLSGVDPLVEKAKEDSAMSNYASTTTIGETALFYICEAGHLDALSVLLQHLDQSTLGYKPLHWAVKKNQAEIVTTLLQRKPIVSHIDDRDEEGNTALYLASQLQDPKTVRALLNGKANVHSRSYARKKPFRPDQRHGSYKQIQPRVIPKCSYTPLHGWARLEDVNHIRGDSTDQDIVEVLDLLLAAGCDINAVDHLGRTALFGWTNFSYRQQRQQMVFVSSLLRRGADATVLDLSGNCVLHGMRGYPRELEVAKHLVEAGANINQARKTDGRTPLINATRVSQLMNPSLFRDLGALFDVQDHDGNTAFHYACISLCMTAEHATVWLSMASPNIQNNAGRLALSNLTWQDDDEGLENTIRQMVELGVDLETRDHLGRTPLLHLFCYRNHGSPGFLKGLLSLGASAKAKDDEGKSALHLLARFELSNCSKDINIKLKYEAMEILVKAGCKLNARDHKGNSIFHDAISWKQVWSKTCGSVIAITKLGADINSPNHAGRTALHSAAAVADDGSPLNEDGSAGTHLDFILRPDLMFDVNMVDLKGISPLHIAASVSEINVWKLIQAGAQIHATDINGRTALHCAAAAGKCNVVDLLVSLYLEQSISVDPLDVAGRTPLHEAARAGSRDSVVTLMLAGADVNIQDKRLRSPLHAAAEFEFVSAARSEQRKFDSNYDVSIHLDALYRRPHGLGGSAFDRMGVVKTLGDDAPRIREVVDLLLEANADAGCLDDKDHTPSDVAIMLGNAQVVQALAPSMAALYSSEDSELDSIDPFGEALLLTPGTDLANILRVLDSATNPLEVLERAISHGDDALVVEAVMSRGLTLVALDGSSPLHLVARLGMTSLMKKLLPYISDINAFSPPLLHAAIERASTNTEMVHILINAGAEVDATYLPTEGLRLTTTSFSIIHILAAGTHWWYPKALSLILDAGANIESLDGYERTPLQAALSRRCANSSYIGCSESVGFWGDQCLDILLSGGATLNTISPNKLTPLNTALSSRRGQSVLQKLLDHGADGGFGPIPAISSAIDSLDIVSLRLLLQAGANPNVVYKATKVKRYEHEAKSETPLLNAATMERQYTSMKEEEQLNIIDLLLKYGADPLQPLGDQSTVLHEIAELNGVLSSSMLKGIDLDIRDSNQMTPLLRACNIGSFTRYSMNGNSSALSLIKAGADIQAMDSEGWTALHYALSANLREVIELLVERGASVTAKNNDGSTPFLYTFITRLKVRRDIVSWAIELLLAAGADPLEEFPDGKTPLHYLAPRLMECSSKDNGDERGDRGQMENPAELIAFKKLYARFIALGCSPEAADTEGNTPIMAYVTAMKYYNEISVSTPPDEEDHKEMFATHDIFKVNLEGDGLLHMIAKRMESYEADGLDGITLFKMLLALGLDPRLENKKGVTPLDVAAACDNQLVLDLFARKDGVV